MTTFRYLTAAEWGMTWARPPQPEQRPDPEVYVHHAGGAAWMHDDAVTVFRQLNTYAQQGKGYSAVDYDILVHYSRGQDVVTIGGARQEWMSAATRDRNELGEAICLCADTEDRAPLAVEVEGVALAVVYGIGKGWIAQDAVILGHRDNPAHPGATACPGRFLYAQLPTIRGRVAELLNPPPPPVPPLQESNTMIPAIAKTTDGAHLAQFEFRGPIYTVGATAQHDVSQVEVFGRGGGRAFDIVNGDIVSWSKSSGGTWNAVTASETTAQVRARMKAAG